MIIRENIHQKYKGHCAYCGKIIDIKEMQINHILAKKNGGTDDFSNLNPSCRRCNHYKRGLNLEDFRKFIKTLHERLESDHITKGAMDYGIANIKPFDGKFYFEKI